MAGKETVKGTFGNEPIELNNAATETTLTAMLKLAQKDSAVLAEMAKRAGIDAKKVQDSLDKSHQGGGGGGGGGGGIGSIGILGGAAKVAGGLIGDMAGMAMSAVNSLGSFVGALASGTTKASELAMAFKDLPLGLGTFAQILSFANKVMEENMDTYRAMSQSGSGIVGSINSMKVSATALGLTTAEYAQLFVNAGDSLVRLGGSMSKGSENLDRMNRHFITTDMARNLLGLGYSYAQLNEMLPNYLKASGDSLDTTKKFRDEMNRLQKASAHYGEDLDYVARATGQNREELQRKKQEMMQEASFQMWMMKQPKEMQTVYNDILTRQLATGGKGLVDATKARLMGFAGSFSKEGQAFNALFGEANDVIEEQIALAGRRMTDDERRIALDRSQVKIIRSMIGNIDGMDTAIMAMGQQMGLSGKGMEEFVSLTNKWRTKEGGFAKSEEEMMADLAKVWANSKDNARDAQHQLDLEAEARKASVAIQQALNPLLIQLRDITISLIREFTKLINENMPQIKLAFQTVIEFVKSAFRNPEIIVELIKGLWQKLLAEMLDLATNSWWGQKLFGDKRDVEAHMDRSAIAFGKVIDKTRYDELKKARADKTANPEQLKILEMWEDTIRKAAGALARQEERGNGPEFNKTDPATIKKATEAAQAAWVASGKNNWSTMSEAMRNAQIGQELRRMEMQWQQSIANDAANIQGNKYSIEDMIDAINRKDYMNVPKRAGGSPGGMAEDWGRESLVKLHGKEAVLTEEQLAALQNQSGRGNTSIELADLKIVAEGILSLNRQAALQNRMLTQMVDNQKIMIQRSSGNRLMV
jgi:hypothetical protein